jgi:hypothetical protein
LDSAQDNPGSSTFQETIASRCERGSLAGVNCVRSSGIAILTVLPRLVH